MTKALVIKPKAKGRKPGRKSKYTAKAPSIVVEMMEQGKSVTQVAASLGVCRDTFYQWYKHEDKPEFKEAVDLGMTLSEAFWENLGLEGTMGNLSNFKPVSWIYTMKCRFRERWIETNKSQVEFSTDTKDMSDKELNEKLKALMNPSESQ